MEYVVWETVAVGNACMLDPIQNAAPERNLVRGIPYAGAFPKDARLAMSQRHKKDKGLTDDLANFDTVKVCSRRLVEFLKDRKLKNVEYLPVTVLDHKGKVASTEYSIVHPILPQDALDVRKSGPSYSPLMKTEIDSVKALVVNPARVDPEVRLFRLQAFFFPVLMDKALAAEIEGEGFTGPFFMSPDQFGR